MEKGIFQGYQDLVKSITSITGSTSIKSTKREEEIFRLEGKLRQLAVEQNQLNSCLEENEKIKKLLGAPLPANWKFMEARVVGISEKMRIDKGEKDGVKEGMMVISENILVGKVVKANENDALIQLLSDSNLKMPVVVKKPSPDKNKPIGGIQARGLLLGQGGEKLLLDRVLQSEDIQKGDLVVTVGEEGWLPDLLVGQIVDVAPKTAEVYQKARVSPLIDYQELRIVFIVIK
jgi:rod shape-determining protein MreC